MRTVKADIPPLTAVFITNLVLLVLAPSSVHTAGSNEIITCTVEEEDDSILDQFLSCDFTFQCPTDCVCTLSHRYMTIDCPTVAIHQIVYPAVLNNLNFEQGDALITISWHNAGLTHITPHAFKELNAVTQLELHRNRIVEIHPGTFNGLVKLQVLMLNYNSISKVPPGSFNDLSNLQSLDLDHNRLSEINPGTFDELVELGILHLGYNSISEIHPRSIVFLVFLDLDHNNLSEISPETFDDLENLLILKLSHNRISKIRPGSFYFAAELIYLDLSHNNLVSLSLSFQEFLKLSYLSLSYNKLSVIDFSAAYSDSVIGGSIEIIDMRKNILYSVNDNSFIGFENTTSILVDNEATCCFIRTVICEATLPRSQFLTCGRLLPNLFQRLLMWLLGTFTLTANIGALYYRYRNKQENTVQVVLISNLSISDMIMGIYMVIVASADLYYKDYFPSELWRHSLTCKIAGTLSILSSEASVLFVTLISFDRFMGIRFTFSSYRLGSKSSQVLARILWVNAIVLSVTSTIFSGINRDWYDVSEVCTGLPLSRRNVYEERSKPFKLDINDFPMIPKDQLTINNTYDVVINQGPGMYYGIAVFTVLNSMCFLTVLICYTGLFITVIQTSKRAGRARNLKEERKMAAKMGVIVMTDLLCWAPIILLSILVQTGGHVVTPHVYTWIVTLVLPINSAINPFLYTLANLIFNFINDHQNRVQTIHI